MIEIISDVDLMFGDIKLLVGIYCLFIDFKSLIEWYFIVILKLVMVIFKGCDVIGFEFWGVYGYVGESDDVLCVVMIVMFGVMLID